MFSTIKMAIKTIALFLIFLVVLYLMSSTLVSMLGSNIDPLIIAVPLGILMIAFYGITTKLSIKS